MVRKTSERRRSEPRAKAYKDDGTQHRPNEDWLWRGMTIKTARNMGYYSKEEAKRLGLVTRAMIERKAYEMGWSTALFSRRWTNRYYSGHKAIKTMEMVGYLGGADSHKTDLYWASEAKIWLAAWQEKHDEWVASRSGSTWAGVLSVQCPYCGATYDERCRTASSYWTGKTAPQPHAARKRLAQSRKKTS